MQSIDFYVIWRFKTQNHGPRHKACIASHRRENDFIFQREKCWDKCEAPEHPESGIQRWLLRMHVAISSGLHHLRKSTQFTTARTV